MIQSLEVGADFSFRRADINRSFCEPTIHVRIFLIANPIAFVKAQAAKLANAFSAPSFAPIAA